MTLRNVVELQSRIASWIGENLKPAKRFNRTYGGSVFLLRYLQREIPEATHEDFKQVMSRVGYFADSQHASDTYSKVYFNVSERSVRKMMEKQDNKKWMEGMF